MGVTESRADWGHPYFVVGRSRPAVSAGAEPGKEGFMINEAYLLIAVIVVAAAYFMTRIQYVHKFQGKMLVTCPETRKPAAVKINSWRAVAAALAGRHHMELSSCSRWPERGDCGQECICQIVLGPDSHRVWTIASRWYEGKKCVYCHKQIEKVSHFDYSPALLDAERKTFEWDGIPTEKLPEALWGCLPVCWSCHMTETFLREHGDLVVMRNWKRDGPLAEIVPDDRDKQSATAPPRAA